MESKAYRSRVLASWLPFRGKASSFPNKAFLAAGVRFRPNPECTPARALRDETRETQRVAVEPGRERIGDRVTVGIRPEHPHAPAEHGFAARTTTVESLGDAAYPYAEWPVAPDGLIARSAPLERHDRGEALTLGASPDHCHLFGKKGRAFELRIVDVLSVA
jgi:multiple sugar transport system ATP-binding protein